MRNDRDRPLDILDAISGIERWLGSREAFDADERTQAWMVSRLQIIGEACNRLSPNFKARHHAIPWRQIVGMRHHLVHGYFDVDSEVVWLALTENIPKLKHDVIAALSSDDSVRAKE